MNGWYIAAILFTAIAAVCTYYGSASDRRRSSEELSSRIEAKLQTLGSQIQDLRLDADSPTQSAKINELDERYRNLAEEFFREIPLRTAQEEARTAKQQVEEIQKTQEIEAHFRAVKNEVEKLAAAYNRSAGRPLLELEGTAVPENLFRPSQNHPAYLLLKFPGPKFWAIRIIFHDRTLALQFVRLVSPDRSPSYKEMKLTNDSINLIPFTNQFGISLNGAISEPVKANITNGLPKTQQPLDQFTSTAIELTRKIIEYELLPLKSG